MLFPSYPGIGGELILTLSEAAEYLKFNEEVLRRKCRAGLVPCRKEGGWRFIKEDLDAWLRSGYYRPAGVAEPEGTCSSNETDGGTSISQFEARNQYAKLLGLGSKETSRRQKFKNSTTSSPMKAGGSTG